MFEKALRFGFKIFHKRQPVFLKSKKYGAQSPIGLHRGKSYISNAFLI